MQVPILNGLCVSAASHTWGHTGTGHWLSILYPTLPRPLSHPVPLHPPRNDFPFVSFTMGPAKLTYYVSVTSPRASGPAPHTCSLPFQSYPFSMPRALFSHCCFCSWVSIRITRGLLMIASWLRGWGGSVHISVRFPRYCWCSDLETMS